MADNSLSNALAKLRHKSEESLRQRLEDAHQRVQMLAAHQRVQMLAAHQRVQMLAAHQRVQMLAARHRGLLKKALVDQLYGQDGPLTFTLTECTGKT